MILRGRVRWMFYDKGADGGFVESSRVSLNPKAGAYGVQIPKGARTNGDGSFCASFIQSGHRLLNSLPMFDKVKWRYEVFCNYLFWTL